MKLRRVVDSSFPSDGQPAEPRIQRWVQGAWRNAVPGELPETMAAWLSPVSVSAVANPFAPAVDGSGVALPCQPLSFRDCMLFGDHWVQSSRRYAKRFLPWSTPITATFERITGRDFPAFRPPRLWQTQPVYYLGNHLTFVPSGVPVSVPSFSRAFDFELELGWIVCRPLRDATEAEAEAAIGGFVVVNDFSSRDVQRAEMQTGLGPQKSKHCVSSMSSTLVTADDLLDRIESLVGTVEINGETLSTTSTRGMKYHPAEVLAFLSRSETLYPGELIASGTLPNGCGLELGRLLRPGDALRLAIEGVGDICHAII